MLIDNADIGITDSFCGIDEAGRGPWAGPVVAAAAIVSPDFSGYAQLNDSKKLTEKRREALFEALQEECITSAAIVTAQEIDAMNILKATMLAMQRAWHGLPQATSLALVDGNQTPDIPCRVQTLVRGDSRSASIAAASIIAKVTRDRMMCTLDETYPGYGFSGHKGYGTKAHRDALEKLGVTPEHRRSFAPIKKLCQDAA